MSNYTCSWLNEWECSGTKLLSGFGHSYSASFKKVQVKISLLTIFVGIRTGSDGFGMSSVFGKWRSTKSVEGSIVVGYEESLMNFPSQQGTV